MTYETEEAACSLSILTSTEPSLRKTLVRLFKGIVTRGFCMVGEAETRRGTTARIVAAEKCIL